MELASRKLCPGSGACPAGPTNWKFHPHVDSDSAHPHRGGWLTGESGKSLGFLQYTPFKKCMSMVVKET